VVDGVEGGRQIKTAGNVARVNGVTGIGLETIYGYVKEIMIIIIASQDGIVR